MKRIALIETGPRCVKHLDGTKEWYLDDKLHRVDGPAVEYPSGTKHWFLNGEFHRADGPAIEDSHGTKEWQINGRLHRVDGPAIEWSDGSKEWYINGKHHRIDGPALEHSNGLKMWYFNNKFHRVDGPAVEWGDGTKYWYLDGRSFGESQYLSVLKIRKFRSRISRFNNVLEFNLSQLRNLSRNRAIVEWYYSPDNGGGKLAKKRLEDLIKGIHYSQSD